MADFQKNDPNREREAISLCGFNCGICPAYKANLKTDGDRAEVDRGWQKFHRTRGWVYQEPRCEGCFNTPGSTPLWSSCPTRKCVMTNNVENCGHCLDYPCSRINWLTHAIDLIAARTKEEGTEDDFKKFVVPYLSRARLDRTHEKLVSKKPDPPHWAIDSATVGFPSVLVTGTLKPTSLRPREFARVLEYLYSTLARIMVLRCRTPGGRQQELKRKKSLARLLWMIAKDGELDLSRDMPSIVITLNDLRERLHYGTSRLRENLRHLSKEGVEGRLTGDTVTIAFPGESRAALLLKHYTTLLLQRNGERAAYSKFWKTDMRVYGQE